MSTRRAPIVAALAGMACGLPAAAQMAPPPSHTVPWDRDSGPVSWLGGPAGEARAVYSTVVTVPGAPWVRLGFSTVELAGVVEEGSGAFLKITSVEDGAVQYLNAQSARQWVNTSAYFNGESVLVELMACAGTGPSRLRIASVTAGDPPEGGTRTICGPTDDRVLSTDPRSARHLPEGCSGWLHDDVNRMFITAGHCTVSAGDVEQFNVPLSTGTGALVNPPPEDQYVVEPTSVLTNNGSGGIGADYAYYGTSVNSNTGLTPFQRQGAFYVKSGTIPAVSGQNIRVTGYGVTSAPVSPTWNQAQKTHTGPLVASTHGAAGTTVSYQVDTTGGNSGSCVHNLATDQAIGIHTHGYCNTSPFFANDGTGINYPPLQSALANPAGVCRSGKGTVTPPIYVIGDGANNFGTCNTLTGNFAKVAVSPPRMEGLAYDPGSGLLYAVSNDTYGVPPGPAGRKLWTIDPSTGAPTYIANISGAAGVINALGYNPAGHVLYGVIQATGTRVVIDATTAVATVDGASNPGTSIGGADFNPIDGLLYGIDDSGGASKLVRFTPDAGAVQVIGPLGAGIADCNGLAVSQSGTMWTINAATEQLLRIDPATGAATVIGTTGGVFGASYGMAALPGPTNDPCWANCDGSNFVPFLNVGDFTCFLQKFAAADPYANCDGSVVPPVLNVADFTCFLQKFAAGCSAP